MRSLLLLNILFFFLFSSLGSASDLAQAEAEDTSGAPDQQLNHQGSMEAGVMPGACSGMMVWDLETAMCEPRAMDGMAMSHLMWHGNGFAVLDSQGGPRGTTALAGPDMFMVDAGKSNGGIHYFNVELMATIEKWTFPAEGYPELLQVGETDANGNPFVDAQHPHNSPIMGLTFSDRITLNSDGDNLKLFFSPRGDSTDGPIVFMHRMTGMVNPDVPLGHHIGQDVGHITSTVVGASLSSEGTFIEGSIFNGTEPEPENVDLPLGSLNSGALRLGRRLSKELLILGSAAYVQNPEPDIPTISSEWRYSISFYSDHITDSGHRFANTLIGGAITNYDNASVLFSAAEEFLYTMDSGNLWGRLEVLQRTPAELLLTTLPNQNTGQWVSALTLGYTLKIYESESAQIGLGGSLTENFLPQSFQSAYGGNPWAGKVFMEVSGMGMSQL